ncbi:hypothetical protein NEMBOFW57_007764 [Staphylotrichum longicolle]|uniref:Heterokaryon incompatibility domain-containing protein n=1 Tax=Staphylotrichum longicolle TaxID=669026 RepID=A0AAD4EVT6_9PEZI|nr:hypothetical protein NEMBOFW57_007764 [Staphylotrichum longicolle]
MASHTLYANLTLPPSQGTEDASIRLLTLAADKSWNLHNTPLTTCPKYKALSYHWGDAYDTLPILCNGVEIQVTRNLHTALDQLKSAFPYGVTIWIDAICINQRDKIEQARQVALMRHIYSRAQEVLIWLEPSLLPRNIEQCFAACKLYASRWVVAGRRIKAQAGVTDDSPDVAWNMLQAMAIRAALRDGNREIFSPGIMDGLLKVFRQPYWSRAWIIQEMCLAKEARILAGHHWLTWSDFKQFLLMLEHCMSDTRPEIYRGYRASGDSQCPTLILRDGPSGRALVLRGMTAGRIATVCRALEIHHQYARLEHPKGIPEPRPPASWNEFSGEATAQFLRTLLFYPSLPRLLMWPVTTYKKGTALAIFLEWARLAEAHRHSEGRADDDLTAMFITLMKGRRGCDFFHHPLTDRPPQDLITEMVNEFRALSDALRWNPLLRLMDLLGFNRYFPNLHWLMLGFSYDHHKGALRIFPTLMAAIQLCLAIGMRYAYFTVPEWLRPMSLFWVVIAVYGNWNILVPATPKWLDAALITPLDYAMAKLDDGRLALVPHNSLPGHEIALWEGSPCPFVVQRSGSGWKLTGDCYVYGMMEGEMWKEKNVEEMEIF